MGDKEEGFGPGGGTRTPDTQFRRLVLYPLSYARPDCKFTRGLRFFRNDRGNSGQLATHGGPSFGFHFAH